MEQWNSCCILSRCLLSVCLGPMRVQQAKLELGGNWATCSGSASCPCHSCTGRHSLSWVPDLQSSRALSRLPRGWGRAQGLPYLQMAIISHRTPSAVTSALPWWGNLQVLLPLERTFGPCSRHSLLEVTQLFPGVQHLWDCPESLLKLLLRDGYRATVAGKSYGQWAADVG